LLVFFLVNNDNLPLMVKNNKTSAGGTLVNGGNVFRHGNTPSGNLPHCKTKQDWCAPVLF
jgi:hypothetical protein